jgi:hypothetical protein
MPED